MSSVEQQRAAELAAAWSDPERLSALVAAALDARRVHEVVSAADHLFQIDPQIERRYFTYARALAHQGHFRRSDDLLDRYQTLYGRTADLELTRADVARERGLNARAEEHCWNAVQLAPNDALVLTAFVGTAIYQTSSAGAERHAIARAAELRSDYLAKLWLGSLLLRSGENAAAEEWFKAALRIAEGASSVVAYIACELVRSGAADAAVRIASAAHCESDPVVALALLGSGVRRFPPEQIRELLAAVDSREELREAASFYRGAVRDLSDADAAADDLARSITTLARTELPRYREECYRRLLRANLVVACEPPLPRMRRDLTLDEKSVRVRLTTRANSIGGRVAIAFTGDAAAALWRTNAATLQCESRDVFTRVLEESEIELQINPAGPGSLELTRSDLQVLARGALPELTHEQIVGRRAYFLLEPKFLLPAAETLAEVTRELQSYPEIAEAWLIQTVDDRHAVSFSIAVMFGADVGERERHELVLDLNDPDRNPLLTRSLRSFEMRSGERLFTTVRELGYPLKRL